MKRHLVYPMDFDTRAFLLEEPGESWEELPRRLHDENRTKLVKQLEYELGLQNFGQKLENFRDAGRSPFSIISYHNLLYQQARYAFIHGFYYPSLVSSCALGERILNHLILDLRADYAHAPEYKQVYRKSSFDDWTKAIAVLEAWSVFQQDDVVSEFRKLGVLRHKSIHFNTEMYDKLRDNALSELKHLAGIISGQFGFASGQRWMIPGSQGHFFVRKDSENDPFIRKYYLPQCPLVGPHFAVKFVDDGVLFFDKEQYDDHEITDDEFVRLFNSVTPDIQASSEFPVQSGVVIVLKIQTR